MPNATCYMSPNPDRISAWRSGSEDYRKNLFALRYPGSPSLWCLWWSFLHRGGPHPDGEHRFTPDIHCFFWDPSVSNVALVVIPGGLCVFPGRRAVPLCSSSSSSAWSCRASLDTAQAGAGRSARRAARWAPWSNAVGLVFVHATHLSFLVPEELAGVFYHLLVRELRVRLLLAEVKYLPQGHPKRPHVTGSGKLALCDGNNDERTLVPTNQLCPS